MMLILQMMRRYAPANKLHPAHHLGQSLLGMSLSSIDDDDGDGCADSHQRLELKDRFEISLGVVTAFVDLLFNVREPCEYREDDRRATTHIILFRFRWLRFLLRRQIPCAVGRAVVVVISLLAGPLVP